MDYGPLELCQSEVQRNSDGYHRQRKACLALA